MDPLYHISRKKRPMVVATRRDVGHEGCDVTVACSCHHRMTRRGLRSVFGTVILTCTTAKLHAGQHVVAVQQVNSGARQVCTGIHV